jgi:preprotein translocase subunit SecF
MTYKHIALILTGLIILFGVVFFGVRYVNTGLESKESEQIKVYSDIERQNIVDSLETNNTKSSDERNNILESLDSVNNSYSHSERINILQQL